MDDCSEINNDSEYIIIPNPIYDVVFKYLMEDTESATIVISTLINQKIKNLKLEPITHAEKKSKTEISEIQDPKTKEDIRLFHLDFTATVELPNGDEEIIMIELQKASLPDDIMRFKRYISKNFQRKIEVERANPTSGELERVEKPVKLIPIFILNFRIEKEVNDLLIQTSKTINGVFKNKSINGNYFIEHLTYDVWIVQLPNIQFIKEEDYAGDEYKEKLFSLLKLFDQKSKVKGNEHRLRLIRRFFPGFLDRVIKRLQAASINNQELEEQMQVEDDYLKILIKRDNTISFLEMKLEQKEKEVIESKQVISEKEQVISEKEQVISEKEQVIYEREQVISEKEQVISEKEHVISEREQELEFNKKIILELARTLKENNVPAEIIQSKTNLSLEVIRGM